MSSLADRIRGIVKPAGRPHDTAGGSAPARGTADLSALGGEWRATAFLVERRIEPSARHGRDAVGTYAECLNEACSAAKLYGGADARPPLVFFDLETTGLSGGAGTQAFLIGCASFDDESRFVTRQFLLTEPGNERPLLDAVAGELAGAGALVSFNGKSFDAPLLETRYLFHRTPWNGRALPHVDVLHAARRFWGAPKAWSTPKGARYNSAAVAQPFRAAGSDNQSGAVGAQPFRAAASDDDSQGMLAQAFRVAGSDCSLASLERHVLGVRRRGDVPSPQIPRRYFEFIRTGDAAPLAAVLEHNRLDLLSLAALAARILHVTREGAESARDAREALALGHVYMRAGLGSRACDAYRRAVEMTERGVVSQLIRIESLRSLAISYRRERMHGEAAACWRRLIDAPGCPSHVAREATEALAVHHEHRAGDLAAAKSFALLGLELDARPAWTSAVEHRLARLERKMGRATAQLQLSSWPS